RERVVDLCAPEPEDAEAPRHLWVGMADEADLILDPEARTTQPAETRPEWCKHSRQATRWGAARVARAQMERKRSRGQKEAGPVLPELEGTRFEDYASAG